METGLIIYVGFLQCGNVVIYIQDVDRNNCCSSSATLLSPHVSAYNFQRIGSMHL